MWTDYYKYHSIQLDSFAVQFVDLCSLQQDGFAPPEDEEIDGARGDQEEFWTPPRHLHQFVPFPTYLPVDPPDHHHHHPSSSFYHFIYLPFYSLPSHMKFNFPKLSSTCEGRLKPDRCGPRSSILVCLTPGQWNQSVATLVTALHDLSSPCMSWSSMFEE